MRRGSVVRDLRPEHRFRVRLMGPAIGFLIAFLSMSGCLTSESEKPCNEDVCEPTPQDPCQAPYDLTIKMRNWNPVNVTIQLSLMQNETIIEQATYDLGAGHMDAESRTPFEIREPFGSFGKGSYWLNTTVVTPDGYEGFESSIFIDCHADLEISVDVDDRGVYFSQASY